MNILEQFHIRLYVDKLLVLPVLDIIYVWTGSNNQFIINLRSIGL